MYVTEALPQIPLILGSHFVAGVEGKAEEKREGRVWEEGANRKGDGAMVVGVGKWCHSC